MSKDIPVYDVTVKSGLLYFAPQWSYLMDYKEGIINWNQYTEAYTSDMRQRISNDNREWLSLLKVPKLALACYCRPGDHCHRHLLKEMMLQHHFMNGHEAIDMGEILS